MADKRLDLSIKFDTNKYYLGKPCKRNHSFDGVGTLRYISNDMCVECKKESREISNLNKQEISLINANFWRSIDIDTTTNCWNWTGSKYHKGYGFFVFRNQPQLAHRIAWVLTRGKIDEGKFVCHNCGNYLCVNPEHLYLGSRADYIGQMVKSGRIAHGERHGTKTQPQSVRRGQDAYQSKLTDELVVHLRRLAQYATEGQFSYSEYAEKYDVCAATIRDAIYGKTWKHLPYALNES